MADTQVDDQTEAVLLVDASNVFNFLNREAAMKNIQSLCPPLAKIVVNTYCNNAPLFIDGKDIPSQERTTQGDPLAMCINAIAISDFNDKCTYEHLDLCNLMCFVCGKNTISMNFTLRHARTCERRAPWQFMQLLPVEM